MRELYGATQRSEILRGMQIYAMSELRKYPWSSEGKVSLI